MLGGRPARCLRKADRLGLTPKSVLPLGSTLKTYPESQPFCHLHCPHPDPGPHHLPPGLVPSSLFPSLPSTLNFLSEATETLVKPWQMLSLSCSDPPLPSISWSETHRLHNACALTHPDLMPPDFPTSPALPLTQPLCCSNRPYSLPPQGLGTGCPWPMCCPQIATWLPCLLQGSAKMSPSQRGPPNGPL